MKLVLEQGLSVKEAAARLSMSDGTLAYWLSQFREKNALDTSRIDAPDFVDLAAENQRLRKELAEAHMECNLLKKAYFPRELLPGMHS